MLKISSFCVLNNNSLPKDVADAKHVEWRKLQREYERNLFYLSSRFAMYRETEIFFYSHSQLSMISMI